ncbi:hypothetical protein Tco_1228681 [Tanacetum coccineum]
MLQRCKDAHLVLNWEKYHFMVKEGIMLRHMVSGAGLEVDKAKIDVISKLPPPTNIKGVRSFLGHVGFYRRFIKDFSKIARPLTKLLEKDTPFEFDDECRKEFELLKEKLTFGAVLDHLSRIDKNKTSDDSEVEDNFPGETLMEINTRDEPCDKMEVGTTTNNLTARLPILNPGDYDLWLMRIEQYFLMTDYSLWEVIKNGNKVLRRTVGTVEQEYEPTTAEEK